MAYSSRPRVKVRYSCAGPFAWLASVPFIGGVLPRRQAWQRIDVENQATLPSPMMVAPAIPSTRRKFCSRL